MQGVICANANDEAELLIIDLLASQRGDLEIIMSEGLAAVRYDCKNIKVLKGCHIEGGYAYKGTLLKEEFLRLENADEVRANLPFSGAKIGASMDRNATLNLAIAMVGQLRAARYEVSQDELKGRCKEATHFVQSAHVGAFVMNRGERAKLSSAVEMFEVGASGDLNSDRALQNADGDIEACRQTKAESSQLESGCGALLRLNLVPISAAGTAPSALEQETLRRPGCPKGMSYLTGKCVRVSGPVCSKLQPRACEQPCARGDGNACGILGAALRSGEQISKNPTAAIQVQARACELGHATSCYRLSRQIPQRRHALLERGCALGSGKACFKMGWIYSKGDGVPQDLNKAFIAYNQGCAAGWHSACVSLGKAYSKGRGVKQDKKRSFQLYKRACEGGSATGCYNVGTRFKKGSGTQRDESRALAYFLRGCHLGRGKSCYAAAKMNGDHSLFQQACRLKYEKACER